MNKQLKIFKITFHVSKSINGPHDQTMTICHYTIDEAFEIIRQLRQACIETRNDPNLRILTYDEVNLSPGMVL